MAGASVLVELGSGTSEKTRVLLYGMAASTAGLDSYEAFDVAEATLREAAKTVAAEYRIGVHAVADDFHGHHGAVPGVGAPRLLAILGSTIGNLTPAERRELYGEMSLPRGPDDRFLLATVLVKPV